MHVWRGGGFHGSAIRRRALLPLQAMSAPFGHDALDDRPLPRRRVLRDRRRGQSARVGPRRRLAKGILRRLRQPHPHHQPRRSDAVAIRLGCLDQDPGIRPQAHQFVAYASSLDQLPDDGLPRFSERLGASEPLSMSPIARTLSADRARTRAGSCGCGRHCVANSLNFAS